MKDKVGHLVSDSLTDGVDNRQIASATGTVMLDVLSALVNLGYPDPVARQALASVKKRVGEENFTKMQLEEMLKEGLRALA